MNVDSVNTTSMSKESMLFCVLHHPSDAEAHNFHLEDPLCLHDKLWPGMCTHCTVDPLT